MNWNTFKTTTGRRCCGIMVYLAALSTRQLDLSRSRVSLFQHTCHKWQEHCRVSACFLHISSPRTTQRCIWKVPQYETFHFIPQKNKQQNEVLTKHAEIFPPLSFVSMAGTFLLAIFQDTCKSLCHDMFSGIFVTALFVVYSLYCLGLLTLC